MRCLYVTSFITPIKKVKHVILRSAVLVAASWYFTLVTPPPSFTLMTCDSASGGRYRCGVEELEPK